MSSHPNIPADYGLTAEYLRTLFTLEEPAGVLRYKRRPVWMFADGKHSAEHTCNNWNNQCAGKEVNPGASDYKKVRILCPDGIKHRIKVHNIIECMRTGKWPNVKIDHINRDSLDNSFENLRPVTGSQSAMNRGVFKNSESGVTGVCWFEHVQKWFAYIYVKGVRIKLYYGDNFDDAVAARKAGELKYFGEYRRCQGTSR